MLPPADREARAYEQARFRGLLREAMRRHPWVVYGLVGALTAVQIGVEVSRDVLGEDGPAWILLAGAQVTELVMRGEVWRVLSSTLLHDGWQHLLVNGAALLLVGRIVEAAYGRSRFVILYTLAGIAGGLASLTTEGRLLVGASAGVAGVLMGLVAMGLRLWPQLARGLRLWMVVAPLALVALFVVGGLVLEQHGQTNVAHRAHLGGALAALAFGLRARIELRSGDGAMLLPSPPRPRWRTRLVQGVGLACVLGLGGASLRAATDIGEPVRLGPTRTTLHRVPGFDAGVAWPVGRTPGVWRGGRCDDGPVDLGWALQTDRTLCARMPLGGWLLLGLRDRLVRLDRDGVAALRRADRTGTPQQVGRGALAYPLADRWAYVAIAPAPLVVSYGRSLDGRLTAPGSATIADPAAPQEPTMRAARARGLPPRSLRALRALLPEPPTPTRDGAPDAVEPVPASPAAR